MVQTAFIRLDSHKEFKMSTFHLTLSSRHNLKRATSKFLLAMLRVIFFKCTYNEDFSVGVFNLELHWIRRCNQATMTLLWLAAVSLPGWEGIISEAYLTAIWSISDYNPLEYWQQTTEKWRYMMNRTFPTASPSSSSYGLRHYYSKIQLIYNYAAIMIMFSFFWTSVIKCFHPCWTLVKHLLLWAVMLQGIILQQGFDMCWNGSEYLCL